MTSTHTTARGGDPWRTFMRRGGLALVVFIVLGAVGGLLATKLTNKHYTGVARVLVSDTGVGTITTVANGRTTGEVNLDTEAQLVTSRGVLDAARKADPELRGFSSKALVGHVAVSVPPNSAVLQIAYTDRTPAAAQNGANAVASAYLDNRRTTAQSQLDAQIRQATATRDDLGRQLESLTTTLRQGNEPDPPYTRLQIALTRQHIQLVDGQLATLEATQVTPGQIVSPATLPASPTSPSRTLYVASGLAIGVILGLIVAWLLTRFRRTVRTSDDLVHAVDAPCVAVLRSSDPSAVGATDTYRHLALVATSALRRPARIVITSPAMSSMCNEVASGVAASLARIGTPTALLQIRDDQSRPVGSTPDMSVTRKDSADEVLHVAEESVSAALDRIREDEDVLIVGVAGATVTADAQALASGADATIIVVPLRSRSRAVRDAVAVLDSVGAPILGTVLVRSRRFSAAKGPAAATPSSASPPRGSSAAKDRAAANASARRAAAGQPKRQ